ncbi:MAG TPA: ABC transporter substrate-binding protein [Spirochaetia bacterium]|nr:ABC transporter substrate-binding protein [Spirochaetia bacterium]
MKKRVMAIVSLFVFLAAGVWANGSQEKSAAKGPIVVASKIDTEGGLLGEMIVAMLKANGFNVIDKTQFGTTSVIRKAIMSGEIDIYPEYTGNGAFFFKGTDPTVWKNAEAGYQTVKKLDMEQNKIVWLTPAPANNTWAIAARKDLAQSKNLKTLSDLAAYVNGGGTVKLAASEEYASRPDGLDAIEKAYGFTLSKDQLLLFSGGNTAQTEKAAADGTNGVNLAMAYGTDGSLAALGLVVLTDTKSVYPVYEPTPIVREAIYKKYPSIGTILAPVFKSLNLETLQTLNAEIAVQGQETSAVATAYLKSKGFLK